jgi:Cu-processing system permease protein
VNATLIVLRKELRDAVQSRWLVAFAVAFMLVALAFSSIGSGGGGFAGQGFNRTTAGLINLSLLLVPLLALVLGAGSIAGERERGTLTTVLSQPLSTTELLLGKYLGLTIASWMAIAFGFGASGLVLALVAPLDDVSHYVLFILLSAGLSSAMLSLGMLVSVLTSSRVKALAVAVLAWFVLVLLYDLGAIGLALALNPSGRALVLPVIGNPVEAVRILAILSIQPDLQVLGPLGAYLTNSMGAVRAAVFLWVTLLIWIGAPLAIAIRVFNGQDA